MQNCHGSIAKQIGKSGFIFRKDLIQQGNDLSLNICLHGNDGVPSTAQFPQLINIFGMQGRLGEVPETDHLRDEQGVPRICFGLTDVEAADGVGLHRVDDLNTEALLLKSGKKSEPVVSGGLHCKGNLVKRQLGLGEHGQQPIVPGAVVGEGKRLDDDCTISVDHGCFMLSLGNVDANDVHSIGSSHVQITDIPRAAEGHNLLQD